MSKPTKIFNKLEKRVILYLSTKLNKSRVSTEALFTSENCEDKSSAK